MHEIPGICFLQSWPAQFSQADFRLSVTTAAGHGLCLHLSLMYCTLWYLSLTASFEFVAQSSQIQPFVPLARALEKITMMLCPSSNSKVAACVG